MVFIYLNTHVLSKLDEMIIQEDSIVMTDSSNFLEALVCIVTELLSD